MRLALIGLFCAATAGSALAQPPAGAGAAPMMKSFESSADVAALIAKAKSELKPGQPMLSQPLLRVAPAGANLEYRVAPAAASVHETEIELFYVIEGSATLVTGGKLANEKRTNPSNLSGTAIEGGTAQHVAKGDLFMVPEGVPHWFSAFDAPLAVMSVHLPRPAPAAR
jgi:mannose-6-phosphate isomerase-like protein (cupin superfamily)